MSESVVKGGVAARINHLRMTHENPVYSLPGMEAHGKRHDATSQARKVGDKPPLVYGSLDIQDAFEAHIKGCLMSQACKAPVLHTILQWPVDLPLPDEAAEQLMLKRSIDFMNRILGGDAVFAARLDRDESGRHTVDIFATPKYMKKTKDGERLWVSTSKHLKALCQKHLAEIKERHPKIKKPDSMRCQGIALNSEFHQFVTSLGMEPKRKVEKNHSVPDRVSPEIYKSLAQARKTIEAGQAMDAALKARERALEASKADFVEFQRVERENAAKAAVEATRAREEALARREAEVVALESKVSGLPMLVREAIALISGDETNARMLERHKIERAASHCGQNWEEDWKTDGRGEKFTPTYWQSLRAHVVDFWRDHIKKNQLISHFSNDKTR